MFKTRSELFTSYDANLRRNIDRYISEGRSVQDQGWIKTQVLEYGKRESADFHNEILRDLSDISTSHGQSVSELDEELFYLLTVDTEEGSEEIYVDARDTRFLSIFTQIKSKYFSRTIDQLTRHTLFDNAWFSTEILNKYNSFGLFRGSGGKFDNRYFFEKEEVVDPESEEISNFSFRSWGRNQRLLDLIQGDDILSHQFALTNIRVRKNHARVDEEYVINDISFNGKITSLGTSFHVHRGFLDQIKNYYKNIVVDNIENRYGLSGSREGELRGESIDIYFPKQIEDLPKFVSFLFSGKKPFMLWGLLDIVDDNFVRVNAVDLHIGSRLLFEIEKSKMTIYLKEDSCGNSILRVYALLQQTYDSKIKFEQEVFN